MDREYNLFKMCCRINSSGTAARTIAGLYILLATFLIGFSTVQISRWIDPYVQIAAQEEISVIPIIKYDCTYYGSWAAAMLRVTNLGSQTLTFEREGRAGRIPTILTDKARQIQENVESGLEQREILPGETAMLWVEPVPKTDFEISIRYVSGDRFDTLSLFVPAASQRRCTYPD